jgi:hypothetical protein
MAWARIGRTGSSAPHPIRAVGGSIWPPPAPIYGRRSNRPGFRVSEYNPTLLRLRLLSAVLLCFHLLESD